MKIRQFSLLLFSALMLSLCTPKSIPYSYHNEDDTAVSEVESPSEAEDKKDEPRDVFAEFSVDSIQLKIEAYVDSIKTDHLHQIEGEFIFAKVVLPEMYETNKFMINWHDNQNRFEALECIKNSWQDGLEPNDYHLEKINELRADILSNTILDYNEIAQFDILLTDGLLLYSYHLIKGKVNPANLDVNWNFNTRAIPKDPTKYFLKAIDNQSVMQTVHGLRPDYHQYDQFIHAMVHYTELQNKGGWNPVPFYKVVKPGEFGDGLDEIRKRLHITGDIEVDEGFMDSLYDDDMADAIKRYQSRHGLNPDGIIGKNTIAALNIPIEKKIEQLKINLERARWVLDDIGNNVVLVNIANFKLFYLIDSIREHQTKVMVGTYYNQTPVFRSRMKYLVFNPTWTVPYSIATKELLPKIKKDPDYLADRNISLLNRSGKVIPQSSVDWSIVTPQLFPYTLRQEPGPGNALGQVKFIFPNKYAVYLHDTPSKYLFVKEERAFSHGCIRVQNPLELAEVLLNDEKWNQEKIQEILHQKKEKVVHLKKPLDVLLLYWTCGFMENGDIFFIKDVYNRDQRILSALSNTDWEELIREYRVEIDNSSTNP